MANQEASGFQMPDTSTITNNISDTFKGSVDNISDTVSNLKSSVNDTVSDFSSKNAVDASSEFLESNTIVAKFAFIILVLIGFMFFFQIGMVALAYFLQPSESPYLVKGLINGSEAVTIPQNSFANNSTILWSSNQATGIEFTYSVWVSFTNSVADSKYHHIFNKGSYELAQSSGLNIDSNSPGLYVKYNTDGTASLRVYMDTMKADPITAGTEHGKFLDIAGIPYKKWVNVIIRCQNRILDVYVNGVLTSRKDLVDVPRQNYGDVFVCQNGGFSGQLSNLRYFAKALNVFEINNIVGEGPSLSTSSATTAPSGSADSYYLSSLWYKSNM
jgi:hypothetical protein